MRLLVIGYGNPGRQDDGLGITLASRLESWASAKAIDWMDFDYNYQLNAEDALKVSEYDAVIFADASATQGESCLFRKIEPGGSIAFSTHSMSPETVLALCLELYGRVPAAHLLTLRGYGFEVNADLTPEAERNCTEALDLLMKTLQKPERLFEGASNLT